jgi:hypothetical protein
MANDILIPTDHGFRRQVRVFLAKAAAYCKRK